MTRRTEQPSRHQLLDAKKLPLGWDKSPTQPAQEPLSPVGMRFAELAEKLLRLRDLTKSNRNQKAMSEGADLLTEIYHLVKILDPKELRRESRRRKPWLAFQAVNKELPILKVPATVTKFVTACCKYVQMELRAGKHVWYSDRDRQRCHKLIKADREGKLFQAVHVDDAEKLIKYCQPPLEALYKGEGKRGTENAWRIWAMAVFHELHNEHKLLRSRVWHTFSMLKSFIELTRHEPFVEMLRIAAPRAALTLLEIKVTQTRAREQKRVRNYRSRKKLT